MAPTSLLHEPPPQASDGYEPPFDRGRPRGSGVGPPPRRRARTGLLVIAALLSGAAGAGVYALADGSPSSATTTVVRTVAGGSTSETALDASTLYSQTAGGVVDITATSPSTVRGGPFGQAQGSTQTASGSGFVLDAQGHIVTAAHVVDGATTVKVTFQDGTTRTATVLGRDDATDVAVIKIDPSGLTLHPLTLGSSASLGVGDAVAAVGDPFGYQRSISTGIVSGLDRTIEAPNGFTVAHAIQTDAALNPGNSGGPVLDANGHVVGIVDQIATNGSSEQSSGVGFAVPIDLIASELRDLEAGKQVTHAYVGVSTSTSTDSGALVGAVVPGGPADKAGLHAGDVVTNIGGSAIKGSNDLVAAIAEHKPGDTVKITIRRNGTSHDLEVTLGTQPTQRSSTSG